MSSSGDATVAGVVTPAEALIRHGEELYAAGDREGAIDAFSAALVRDASSVRARNNLGVAYWEAGQVDLACEHFAKALETDPLDRATLLNACEALASTGRAETAAALCRMQLRRNPEDAEVAAVLAACASAAAAEA